MNRKFAAIVERVSKKEVLLVVPEFNPFCPVSIKSNSSMLKVGDQILLTGRIESGVFIPSYE